MKHFTERVRWLPYVALVVIGFGLFEFSRQGFFDSIDGPVVNWLARVFGHGPLKQKPKENTTKLTLVEINNETVEQSWPLKALDYAIFFRALLQAEASLAAVTETVEIDEVSEFAPALESYMLRTPQLLLAWLMAPAEQPGSAFEAKPVLRRVQGAVMDVPSFEGAAKAPSEPFSLIGAQGFVNLADAPGRMVRKIPLLLRVGRDLLPSFTLRAAMQFYGVAADEVVVTIGKEIVLADRIKIPIDHEGMLLLPPMSQAQFSRLAFDEFLLAAERRETSRHPMTPLGSVQGAVVFLGRTDADSRAYRSPEGAPVSLAEIMAVGLDCVQRGIYFRRTPLAVVSAILGSMLGLMAFMKCLRRWRSVLAAAAYFIVYCVVAIALLNLHSLWPPLTPVAILVLAIVSYRLWLPTRIQRVGLRKGTVLVAEVLRESSVKRYKQGKKGHGSGKVKKSSAKNRGDTRTKHKIEQNQPR